MHSPLFLKNKIARQLIMNGCEYEFKHYEENEYHENVFYSEIIVKGIYHEQNAFEVQTKVDGAITHSKKSPMILCLIEDAIKVNIGDEVEISGNKYTVTSKNNIQNYDVAYDISLEVVI